MYRMKGTIILDVEPDYANNILLEKNINNRNMSLSRVNQLANDMSNGNFKDNGDVFRFDINGNLLDGQHRLAAIVKSGVTLKNAIFITGLDPDVMDTIDRGKKRTTGDIASILGYKNSNNVAALAVMHAQYDRGDFLFKTTVPTSVFEAYLKDNIEAYNYGISVQRKMMAKGFKVASWFALVISIFYSHSKELAKKFSEGLVSGENLNAGDARLAFREYLYKTTLRLDNYTKPYFVQTIIKTVNKFFKNEQCKDVGFRPSRDTVTELCFTNCLAKDQARQISDIFKRRYEKKPHQE